MRMSFDGTDEYESAGGRVVHSSELDSLSKDAKNDEDSDSREGPDDGYFSDRGNGDSGNSGSHKKRNGGPLDVSGKTVAVVGSGASGVEAAEWALAQGAARAVILARDDKWIIPQNVVIDTMLSMQPFGREMPLRCAIGALLLGL